MELLILIFLLSLEFVGFCVLVAGFLLWRRTPLSLSFMKTGAFLAAATSVLIVVIPFAVPWWDYDFWSYWTRSVAVAAPLLAFIVLSSLGSGSFRRRT
ncbi:MAG: hypothetical protein L0Y72_06630 [Gemmataceae bacterium]|nr:hypothetical protein [Gemmataceae bacterium]